MQAVNLSGCVDRDWENGVIVFWECHDFMNQRWTYNPETGQVVNDFKDEVVCWDIDGISKLFVAVYIVKCRYNALKFITILHSGL